MIGKIYVMGLANLAALAFYCYHVFYLGHFGSQARWVSSYEARCLFVGSAPVNLTLIVPKAKSNRSHAN